MTHRLTGQLPESNSRAEQLQLQSEIRQLGSILVPYGPGELRSSIVDRFERMVKALPSNEIARDETRSVTYSQLNRKANRIAHAIHKNCKDRQQAIGIIVEHGVGTLEAVLGVLKSGSFYVPLDPVYPQHRLRYVLEDVEARTIVTDLAHYDLARSLCNDDTGLVVIDSLPGDDIETDLGIRTEPEDIAYIVYTSGSTGDPKGVIETHRDVKWFAGWFIEADRITQADVQTGFTALSFSGLAASLYVSLFSGATTLLLDPGKIGVERLLDSMRTNRVTHVSVLPSLFRRMKDDKRFTDGWPTIRLARFGGSAVGRDDVKDFFNWARYAHLRHSLGMSEIKHICSYLFAGADAIPSEGVPIGYESDGVDVLLLDNDGVEVPAGEIGEIVVKGAFISPGYWKLPDVTAQVFYGQPNGEPDRYMRTGDLAVRDENGCLFHRGRKDFQVKVKGYRVELEDVENAVRNAPGVAGAAVGVGGSDSSEEKLVAVFVPGDAFESTAAVRRSVARFLPFQMVPTIYIEVTEIPMTSTGEIDRKEIARLIS